MNGHTDARKIILLLIDAAVFYGSLLLVLFSRYNRTEKVWLLPQHFVPFSFLFAVWIVVFYIMGLYELRYLRSDAEFIRRLVRGVMINAGISILVFYFVPSFGITPRFNLTAVLILSTMAVFVWRQVVLALFQNITKQSILFLGATEEVVHFAEYLIRNPQYGYRVAVLMKTDNSTQEMPRSLLPVLKFQTDLKSLIESEKISLIVASTSVAENVDLSKILLNLIPLGISITTFPNMYGEITGRIPISLITERWFLDNAVLTQRFFFDQVKRTLDIVVGAAGLFPLVVFTPLIALAIRLESRGPVFYKQKRVGKNGEPFTIYKFRSMVVNAEMAGAQWASEDDPRVTKVGKFLRKSRLDELPQILSIIQGSLSFVGPRPERPEFVSELERIIPFYAVRLLVKPGLTGWAQVNFPYGSSVEDAYRKLQYDLFYIQNRSTTLDLTIFLKTFLIVFSRSGT